MVNKMKKRFIIYCLFPLAVFFTTGSCDVEPFSPVFYTISLEVKPIEPSIKGAPTNFAVYNNALFVASGKDLWEYAERSEDYCAWEKNDNIGAPANNEKIVQIASTSKSLYALCNDDSNSRVQTSLKQYSGSGWVKYELENANISMQHIFAAHDTLFIGVRTENSRTYNIRYLHDNEIAIKEFKHLTRKTNDDGEETIEIDVVSGEISGAAYDGNGTYYISTKGKGIFKTASLSDENGTILIPDSGNIEFTGIINLKDSVNTIAAITRGGELYTVKDSVTKVAGVSMDSRMSTGALAVWVDKDDASRRLLLAGRQDALEYSTNSGYTYGYMELELDENGITGTRFVEPGLNNPSTVDDDNELFISTIGKHPVNFIFQTPRVIDDNMTLFASTQQSGLWSYRVRGNTPQWNAEDGQHQ
jgi:hypothetical protein